MAKGSLILAVVSFFVMTGWAASADQLAPLRAYLELAANGTAIAGFAILVFAALRAKREWREARTRDQLINLYARATAVFRAGLTIQRLKKEGSRYDLQPLIDARDVLKNWFFDHRFLFDKELEGLMGEVNEECKQIAHTLCMDKLQQFRAKIEERLS